MTETIAYPERIEDAPPESEVGRLHVEYERCSAAASELRRELKGYEEQRAGYERLVRTATPASDMVALAAAKAGLQVLDRAIAQLQPRLNQAIATEQIAMGRLREAWEASLATLRYLTGGYPAYVPREERRTPDALRAEIRRLVGA